MAKTSQLQIRVSPAEKGALKRAARRSGLDVSAWVLSQLLSQHRLDYDRILHQLSQGEIVKFAFAELSDFLDRLPPKEFHRVLEEKPSARLSELQMNLVAAMVELAAHRKTLMPPLWTTSVRPLAAPFFGTESAVLRRYLLQSSPPAFRRRNLFVDSSVGDRV